MATETPLLDTSQMPVNSIFISVYQDFSWIEVKLLGLYFPTSAHIPNTF